MSKNLICCATEFNTSLDPNVNMIDSTDAIHEQLFIALVKIMLTLMSILTFYRCTSLQKKIKCRSNFKHPCINKLFIFTKTIIVTFEIALYIFGTFSFFVKTVSFANIEAERRVRITCSEFAVGN